MVGSLGSALAFGATTALAADFKGEGGEELLGFGAMEPKSDLGCGRSHRKVATFHSKDPKLFGSPKIQGIFRNPKKNRTIELELVPKLRLNFAWFPHIHCHKEGCLHYFHIGKKPQTRRVGPKVGYFRGKKKNVGPTGTALKDTV